jgi:alpha/beta superfamily hydrolase
MNCTLFTFDFSGCGRSEGQWVTLGYKEQDDLQTVIDHLRGTNKVSLIGLWGRSMGAVTSIFYTTKLPT